jgi:hypothetical protein
MTRRKICLRLLFNETRMRFLNFFLGARHLNKLDERHVTRHTLYLIRDKGQDGGIEKDADATILSANDLCAEREKRRGGWSSGK